MGVRVWVCACACVRVHVDACVCMRVHVHVCVCGLEVEEYVAIAHKDQLQSLQSCSFGTTDHFLRHHLRVALLDCSTKPTLWF